MHAFRLIETAVPEDLPRDMHALGLLELLCLKTVLLLDVHAFWLIQTAVPKDLFLETHQKRYHLKTPEGSPPTTPPPA